MDDPIALAWEAGKVQDMFNKALMSRKPVPVVQKQCSSLEDSYPAGFFTSSFNGFPTFLTGWLAPAELWIASLVASSLNQRGCARLPTSTANSCPLAKTRRGIVRHTLIHSGSRRWSKLTTPHHNRPHARLHRLDNLEKKLHPSLRNPTRFSMLTAASRRVLQ